MSTAKTTLLTALELFDTAFTAAKKLNALSYTDGVPDRAYALLEEIKSLFHQGCEYLKSHQPTTVSECFDIDSAMTKILSELPDGTFNLDLGSELIRAASHYLRLGLSIADRQREISQSLSD